MTKIQWTNSTWNPTTGCVKVSAGCKNCYAERDWPRVYGASAPANMRAKYGVRKFTDVVCHEDRLDQPLRWRRPRMVFVNSMSDLFHDDVPDEFICAVFDVMRACWAQTPRREHTFQILTKRAERMRDVCRRIRFDGMANDGQGRVWLADHPEDRGSWPLMGALRGSHPLPNVWLGVSCENQETADERIPILLDTPAAIRWVSAEPLLGPIEFDSGPRGGPPRWMTGEPDHDDQKLDWVVAGGESGLKARPCDVGWIRSIVKQCRGADVPVFVKQLGANPRGLPCHISTDDRLRDRKGGDMSEWPEDLRVREWPEILETAREG